MEIYAWLKQLFSIAIWCPLLNGNIVFEISKPDMPYLFSNFRCYTEDQFWRRLLKIEDREKTQEVDFNPLFHLLIISPNAPNLNTNLGYVNSIPDSFCATSKTIPDMTGLLFTHKNGDSGVISVMLQGCAVSCRSLKWRVTSLIGLHTIPPRVAFAHALSRKPYRIW